MKTSCVNGQYLISFLKLFEIIKSFSHLVNLFKVLSSQIKVSDILVHACQSPRRPVRTCFHNLSSSPNPFDAAISCEHAKFGIIKISLAA